MAEAGPLAGATLELDVGGPAHGGSCVARHGDPTSGRAVFVRHALPGERVRAVVTEDRGGSYCFADAVEIVSAAPERVEPPCPHAGPGRCGGCDWQHASGAAQRALKETVIRDQFTRLARLELGDLLAGVEELPGGLLGWRSRILWARDRDGAHGLRKHRSHDLEPLDHCPLAQPDIADFPVLDDDLGRATGVEQALGADPEAALLVHSPGSGRQARGRRPPDRVRVVRGPEVLHHDVRGRTFGVQAGGFWQVHPAAAETFAAALLDAVAPRPGEHVLDLYAGVGALTAPLAEAVGPLGSVLGVESAAAAVADAAANLADLPNASVQRARVTAESLAALEQSPDVIVLDPPRAGAGREVMQALLALAPRVIGYVACDPAALARDTAVALSAGWRLTSLRAFDAFPMTHHVECVARFEPASG